MSEVTFNAFVVSLATTAAVHFGDVTDPGTGHRSDGNLDAAGQAIEMLALLEEKTRGNLTANEVAFLQRMLYELRARFVDAKTQAHDACRVSDDGGGSSSSFPD